jgi:hypothetical protein
MSVAHESTAYINYRYAFGRETESFLKKGIINFICRFLNFNATSIQSIP